jgi:hypothetical protein
MWELVTCFGEKNGLLVACFAFIVVENAFFKVLLI